MITLYGVTEDGISVPVQVTEEGKIVAIGQRGPEGPPGKDGQDSQVPGPEGPPGEVQNGDDVNFGKADLSGPMTINRGVDDDSAALVVANANGVPIRMNCDGSMFAATLQCGFTSAGELVFTSRGDRYKLIVQSNLCYPDPYPLTKQLQEKADQLREPKTQDIVLPDE